MRTVFNCAVRRTLIFLTVYNMLQRQFHREYETYHTIFTCLVTYSMRSDLSPKRAT